MRLKCFEIKNYNSIKDSGTVELSQNDNITMLAGQNESGKSSILRALHDFEKGAFSTDSIPFSMETSIVQSVSCTYEVEDRDNLTEELSTTLCEEANVVVEDGKAILDAGKISKLTHFTITREQASETLTTTVDSVAFNILKAAILNRSEGPMEKYLELADDDNPKVAKVFWRVAPKMVLFDDFCDLLPDKILVSELDNSAVKGSKAVKNLETILKTSFLAKDGEQDRIRRTREDKENSQISIDFQRDWGQKIHDENAVTIKSDFQKRDGKPGSYVNFSVETKEGFPLPPRQRSKGLIWFLSLWMELKAQTVDESHLILLLDEPDQHLHVNAQKDVLKLISTLATKGAQVLCATHSPYLLELEHLNRIKLILNLKEEGTIVEDITTSKVGTQSRVDALKPIADTIGVNLGDLSHLGEKNVLLEGVSDFYYFQAMKKILKREGDYKLVPGIGVRKINNLISFCIGYGLKWVAVLDDDPKSGGNDSRKKFEEIRDYAFDGDDEKTKEKVYVNSGFSGIERMFEVGDIKLVDPSVSSIGKGRKIVFSRLFYEKVKKSQITASKLSEKAKEKFGAVFDFIDKNLT